MSEPTAATLRLRVALERQRSRVAEVLAPRRLGSGAGNELLRVAVRVDVVAASLLRDEVSATVLADAVAG